MSACRFTAYWVVNAVNGKKYIGATGRSVDARWYEHLKNARTGQEDVLLHQAIQKHGPERFSCVPVASAKTWVDICAVERALILQEQTHDRQFGYNQTLGGVGSLGLVHTAETRARLSEMHKGKSKGPHSPEHRAKIGAAHRGRIFSPERRAAMSAARLGVKQSPETAAKSARSRTGLRPTVATKAKMSAALVGNTRAKGCKRSAETKAKISAALRARHAQ
jgi:group I intron endonuclease